MFCKEIKASWGSNSRERYNSRLFQCFVRKLKRAGTVIQEKDAIADYFKVRGLKRVGAVIQKKDEIAD